MLLRDWLRENRLTTEKFAEMAKISVSYSRQLAAGKYCPNSKILFKIREVTGGKVSCRADFLSSEKVFIVYDGKGKVNSIWTDYRIAKKVSSKIIGYVENITLNSENENG